MAEKYYNYFLPGVLAVLIFLSNFLSTEIFKSDVSSFAVWFLLSLFVFVCGWLISKNFGWVLGGKILFTVTVGMIVISLAMVVLFKDYFDVNNPIAENLILYSLRNILLGSIAMFGMTAEVTVAYHKDLHNSEIKKNEVDGNGTSETNKMTELIISEAKFKAEKIIFDAEKRAGEIKNRIERLESKLKEFIFTEKELIKKYENEEKNEL